MQHGHLQSMNKYATNNCKPGDEDAPLEHFSILSIISDRTCILFVSGT